MDYKLFKCTFVNLKMHSVNGGSLKTTFTDFYNTFVVSNLTYKALFNLESEIV